ncbi:MAG: MMPL family transporter [Treponema sp.]|jgi:predicted exporter|nr:MMPL family transporter [Treponema sp.]
MGKGLPLWLGFHGALALLLGASLLFASPLGFNTDLLDILPPARGGELLAQAADKVLTERSARQITVLAAHQDFAAARRAGSRLYAALAGSPFFESLSFETDADASSALAAFFHAYRYALLDEETALLLESAQAGAVARDALANAYGMFTLSSLDTLETDPFLLGERNMRSLLASPLFTMGALSPRDGVLCAERDGRWFVMLRGAVSAAGSAFSHRENAVTLIYAAAKDAAAGEGGGAFYFSGAPFHTFESASATRKEVARISALSLLLVAALFVLVFRSLLPAALSLAAALLSIGTALAGSLLFFRELHLITLVFGTALIGTSLDYSIHYCVLRYRGGLEGPAVRERIGRGIALGFASTEICFLLLLFAPFAILKQFALFSLFGMASSYLTVTRLYPLLPLRVKNAVFAPRRIRRGARAGILAGRIILAVLALIAGGFAFLNREKLAVHNDIRGLYTAPPFLAEQEQIVSQTLDYGASPQYFLVAGASEQETLEQEEALRALLDREIAEKQLRSFVAVSSVIPPLRRQERNRAAAAKLLPLAAGQFAALGFPPDAAEAFIADFEREAGRRLRPSSEMPRYFKDLLENLWIGELGGRYYSCVLLIRPEGDGGRFRQIAAGLEGVYFVNKAGGVGENLDALTGLLLKLYGAAYLAVLVLAKCFYPWRDVLRIGILPLLLALACASALILADIPAGFFPVCAFLLVFGLGLDYSFYCLENKRRGNHGAGTLAVALSFLTTLLSFGALAFSGFTPVRVFGLVIGAGLSTAFVSALLLGGGAHDPR